MNQQREWLWYQLASIREIGPVTAARLLEYAGSLEEVLALSVEELEESGFCSKALLKSWEEAGKHRKDLRREYEALSDRGIYFYSMEHEQYPGKLRHLADAPIGLWVVGMLPEEQKPAAAVIGSRGCTAYGLEMARSLGRRLARMGVQVISGMAMGIDGASQRGALQEDGYSLGVLAGGVDRCYPKENIELYELLCRRGGILSERAPGTPALPALFRLRNRLISGLADCVIVVEAREKSGTQITVNCALDQGKEVFALPGRVTDPLSKGCNQMISQGARILWDFGELAEFFHQEADQQETDTPLPPLDSMEQMVYDHLTEDSRHFEELLQETGLPVGELMTALLHLELKGIIHQDTKNYYRR